jgi:hypothetical protein
MDFYGNQTNISTKKEKTPAQTRLFTALSKRIRPAGTKEPPPQGTGKAYRII